MDARGYHLTNLLLHCGERGADLFHRATSSRARGARSRRRRRAAPRPSRPAFAALFFAIHPLRVESVAWVTERRDVLSGCFFWAAALDLSALRRRPGARATLVLDDAWPLRLRDALEGDVDHAARRCCCC